MFSTNRFNNVFFTNANPLRTLSIYSGVSLILAGLTILLFPHFLIAMIAAAFMTAGVLTLINAFRQPKRSAVRYTWWNE